MTTISTTISTAVHPYDIATLGDSIGTAIFSSGVHEARALADKVGLRAQLLESIVTLRTYHISQAGEQHAAYVAGCIALFGEGINNGKNYVRGEVRRAVEGRIADHKAAHKAAFLKAHKLKTLDTAPAHVLEVYTLDALELSQEHDKVLSGLKSALTRARMIYKAVWTEPGILLGDKGLRGINAIYADAAAVVATGKPATKTTAQEDTKKGADAPAGKPANQREAFEMLAANAGMAQIMLWAVELLKSDAAYAKKHNTQITALTAISAQLK